MTAQEYLEQPVIYGGLPATVGEVIQDLEARGLSDKEIGLYLFGLLRNKEPA